MANMEASLLRTHDGEKELDKIYKVNVSPLSPKTQQGSRTLSNRSENSIRLANLKDANKRSESHRLSKTSSVDEEYLPVEVQSERMDSLNSTQEFISQAMLHNDSINNVDERVGINFSSRREDDFLDS